MPPHKKFLNTPMGFICFGPVVSGKCDFYLVVSKIEFWQIVNTNIGGNKSVSYDIYFLIFNTFPSSLKVRVLRTTAAFLPCVDREDKKGGFSMVLRRVSWGAVVLLSWVGSGRTLCVQCTNTRLLLSFQLGALPEEPNTAINSTLKRAFFVAWSNVLNARCYLQPESGVCKKIQQAINNT